MLQVSHGTDRTLARQSWFWHHLASVDSLPIQDADDSGGEQYWANYPGGLCIFVTGDEQYGTSARNFQHCTGRSDEILDSKANHRSINTCEIMNINLHEYPKNNGNGKSWWFIKNVSFSRFGLTAMNQIYIRSFKAQKLQENFTLELRSLEFWCHVGDSSVFSPGIWCPPSPTKKGTRHLEDMDYFSSNCCVFFWNDDLL